MDKKPTGRLCVLCDEPLDPTTGECTAYRARRLREQAREREDKERPTGRSHEQARQEA